MGGRTPRAGWGVAQPDPPAAPHAAGNRVERVGHVVLPQLARSPARHVEPAIIGRETDVGYERRDEITAAADGVLVDRRALAQEFPLEQVPYCQREIVARATDVPSGRPVVVTQALRFSPDHYLRVFGMVRADARETTLSRFRAVSDAIEPK